jgi:hypothetical protein
MATLVVRLLAVSLAVAALGLAGCGGDDGVEVRTVTVPAAESAPADGDAILIETRVTDAAQHMGEVLRGSVIGESAFCPGGKTSGGSEGALITTTFRCSDGTLKVQFAPIQHSLVQSAEWVVVSGTGRYKDLRGGGWMVARFKNPEQGGETFTGTVSE